MALRRLLGERHWERKALPFFAPDRTSNSLARPAAEPQKHYVPRRTPGTRGGVHREVSRLVKISVPSIGIHSNFWAQTKTGRIKIQPA